MMKILWLNHRDMMHPLSGGAERTIYEVGRRLAARGHDLHLLSGGWKGSKRHETMDGIHIHRYGNRVLPLLVNPVFLRYHKDANVIIDDMAHAAPWFSPWLSKSPGIVFFRHLHARTLNGQTNARLATALSFIERRYPFIYTSWPFVTESLSSEEDLNSLGINSSRIFKIPPGVDTNLFKPIQKSEKPSLVYFGGMKPYKRPEHALAVLRILLSKGHDISLTMVGEGTSTYTLKSLSHDLGLESKVSFVGKVTDQELSRVVSSAWVNIHCSRSEGWGLSITEAAASGTPTVAYKVPGVRENVVQGQTGILVKDGDISGMADAIEVVLQTRMTWLQACVSYANRFSWETTTEAWERILKIVAESL